MNAERKMQQARTELVLTQPFFGALALRLPIVPDPAAKTAWTNGKTLGYNPAYIDSLSVAETVGLIAHEVMHCAALHHCRREDRDPAVWNKAADYAINGILAEAKLTLPGGALIDPQYDGKSAEAIYSAIAPPPPPPMPPAGGAGGSADAGAGEGESEESDNASGGSGDPGEDGTEESESANQEQEEEQAVPGEVRDAPEDNAAADAGDWEVATLQAAQIAAGQGRLSGSLDRLVKEIRRPKVDWRSTLRRFVQNLAASDYSWRTPNPRYACSGIYLPALKSESLPPIVLAVDTSGSVGPEMLEQFCAEAQAVLDETMPESLFVISCDADVQTVQEFLPGDAVRLSLKGGGGTDFRPVFKYIEQQGINPAAVIYLTDLCGAFPDKEPEYPTLWVTESKYSQAPFGETVLAE